MQLPVLYTFRRCPYAIRARLALGFSCHSYEHREIELKNKPAAMLYISPKGTVPVLLLPDGKVIDESYDIVLWALQRNYPINWLKMTAAAKNITSYYMQEFNSDFIFNLNRYKYPDRYENVDMQQHKVKILQFINN